MSLELHIICTNVSRCYVHESNTCEDATPSKWTGWIWSCKACDTHWKKRTTTTTTWPQTTTWPEPTGIFGDNHCLFDLCVWVWERTIFVCRQDYVWLQVQRPPEQIFLEILFKYSNIFLSRLQVQRLPEQWWLWGMQETFQHRLRTLVDIS